MSGPAEDPISAAAGGGTAPHFALSGRRGEVSLWGMDHASPEPTPDSVAPRTGRSFAKNLPLALIAVGAVAVAIGVAVVPPDRTLGSNVRLVFFHGAVTWTGIVMAWTAGVLGLAFLLLRRPDARRVWLALSMAALFWVGSLAISFPVMIKTWGGVLWNEPKLLMSAEVVTVLLVAWAIGLVADRPRLTAALALASLLVMAVLLAITPGAFHPDNPIMASGDVRYIGTFGLIVAGLLGISGGLVLTEK